MRTSPARLPEISVLEDTRTFASMKGEWEDLHRHSPLATPFQSWAWLYSWWEAYGEDYELRLITMRDEQGLLVGLAPMMLERKIGFTRLLFVGTGGTEYMDVISREGREDGVAEAAARGLRKLTGPWSVADLQQLRPGALSWEVFRRWGGFRTSVWQDSCPIMRAGPWEEVLAPLSANLRSTFRRAVRRAEKDGVGVIQAEPEEAERAAERFMALHRETWRGREIVPEHQTERFAGYMTAAARRMTRSGLGGIREFRRDGEVIASHFVIFGRESVGYFLSGSNEDARRRYQISSLFIWDGVNTARERGKPLFDLLRGEDGYKLRWNPTIVPNHRAILGRNPLTWAPYAGCHALFSASRRYANSEHAPGWVRSAKGRYGALRFRLQRTSR